MRHPNLAAEEDGESKYAGVEGEPGYEEEGRRRERKQICGETNLSTPSEMNF